VAETSKCDVDAMEVFRHHPNLSDEINRNLCQSAMRRRIGSPWHRAIGKEGKALC